ncbi:hypothetical protein SDRG_13641 [Saprolegnia diclina VS20]|uniref:Uncharacterized protein n=1 Tax=Saprolegnia diclina (strain VS20) TaxID=1156394 RepID=T0R8X7_SAPDV|nr:hypothetical protein SDRG_13641 [Saprolegnia diclina VS20]EQC28563.1 hypothetical protein SDRG_13641 [Saprolegnia diclina VS20]|eukprot:XP_008617960.1 hypothetical protein SDRG_13641 [Saprolegnia diclina VS20]
MLFTANKSLIACAYGQAIFIYNGASSFLLSTTSQVVAIALNAEATLLSVVTQDKKLTVYEMNSTRGEVVSTREVPRNTTSMVAATYGGKEAVLVGGNAGEVNAYPLPDVTAGEKSLLQHTTSIITDVAMSIDGKYLLTADRDEKVRVSHFPATTLVQNYCLGHRQCVRKIATCTVTPSLFVSVGLDDALHLWDIETGALLDAFALETSDTKHCGLSVCPLTNRIALVRNTDMAVRFFSINADKKIIALPLTLPEASQPTNVVFNESGHVLVGYKAAPFLQQFDIAGESPALKSIAGVDAFATIAETTVLGDVDEEDGDSDDGELRKKKLKPSHWKSKMPGHKGKEMTTE